MTAALGVVPVFATDSAVQLEVHQFTLRLSDAGGEVRTVLRGERMRRMATAELDQIDEARLELFDETGLLWIWTAPSGEHDPTGRSVFLSNPIGYRLPRAEQPALRIDGVDARILIDERVVITDQRVTVQHAGLWTSGVGMRASLDSHRVEWYSAVETEFQPETGPEATPRVDR